MPGPLHDFLTRDHERLDALLALCLDGGSVIPKEPYDEFRRGLLRHIGIEERVLFPMLRSKHGLTVVERQLHRDHAALAALLVPPPGRWELEQIAGILAGHNDLEERVEGMYELVERTAGESLQELLDRAHAIPQTRVAAHTDSSLLRATITQLLEKAAKDRAAVEKMDLLAPASRR